jgi:hypothetical protein
LFEDNRGREMPPIQINFWNPQGRRGRRAIGRLCVCAWTTLTSVYRKHNPGFLYVWDESPIYPQAVTSNQKESTFFLGKVVIA